MHADPGFGGVVDTLFKSRHPRRYIQVNTSVINGGTQIIAICSDITKIKEAQSQIEKIRSTFFSSVAHELRTPLNSIIPILKMILDQADLTGLGKRIRDLLKVVLNSSLHLQNVIEDALDLSRLENNKFQLVKDYFDIRSTLDEVC